MISRKLLCSALLACVMPVAASAAEATLSPATNGGSGQLPSGYSRLHFQMSQGDWVNEVKLPASPRDGDQVTLRNSHGAASLLMTDGSVLEGVAFAPIKRGHDLDLSWNAHRNTWDVWDGASSRGFGSIAVPELTIPSDNHMLTQIEMWDGAVPGRLYLASSAERGALTVVSNYSARSVAIDGSRLLGGQHATCPAMSQCTYVFTTDGKWNAGTGKKVVRATQSLLPTPEARLSDVVIGNIAEDVETPFEMQLPAAAMDGDVYRFMNPNPRGSYLVDGEFIGTGYTVFQYDANTLKWTYLH